MKIFLTGPNGFVGRGVHGRLLAGGEHVLRVAYRRGSPPVVAGVEAFTAPDLDPRSDWCTILSAVDVLIHCAARVHIMNEQAGDPLAEFRRVNVGGTLALAHQAAKAGVRRFIFISSIKVNGECTALGAPFCFDDVPAPIDPYGISKREAEQGLLALAADSDMEVVIIRPPLVYGPGVKANFRSMMSWLNKGVLLPFAATNNKRSLVALDNLVDLIVTCIDHPAAANQIFLVSDGEDMSTTVLLQRMGQALGKTARLLPVPALLLQAGAALVGKREFAQRLCASLQVDISRTRTLLGWEPPISVDEAMRRTAEDFLAQLKDGQLR